jgi:uncharacterized protein
LSAVVDTSALIALARLSLLALLPALFGEVYVPRAVADEWSEGINDEPEERMEMERAVSGWLKVRVIEPGLASAENLGSGERQVIALALHLNADFAVIDDMAARKVAASAGIRAIGTVGVLLAARDAGLVPSVFPLLETFGGKASISATTLCRPSALATRLPDNTSVANAP